MTATSIRRFTTRVGASVSLIALAAVDDNGFQI